MQHQELLSLPKEEELEFSSDVIHAAFDYSNHIYQIYKPKECTATALISLPLPWFGTWAGEQLHSNSKVTPFIKEKSS